MSGNLTPCRHLLRSQHHLHRHKWDLHRSARANACEDLIPNPLSRSRVHPKRIQQARTNREDGGADPHEGCVPAELGDAAANGNGRERNGDEVRDRANAGALGRCRLDGLKVEGQEVDVCVQAHGQEGGEDVAGPEGAVAQEFWGYCRPVRTKSMRNPTSAK